MFHIPIDLVFCRRGDAIEISQSDIEINLQPPQLQFRNDRLGALLPIWRCCCVPSPDPHLQQDTPSTRSNNTNNNTPTQEISHSTFPSLLPPLLCVAHAQFTTMDHSLPPISVLLQELEAQDACEGKSAHAVVVGQQPSPYSFPSLSPLRRPSQDYVIARQLVWNRLFLCQFLLPLWIFIESSHAHTHAHTQKI